MEIQCVGERTYDRHLSAGEREQIRALGKISFVEEAAQRVLFDKLQYDGYIYCAEGLYPANKDILTKQLKHNHSPFQELLKKNAESYEELKNRFDTIGYQKNKDRQLTYEECQGIVYAVLETNKGKYKTDCVIEMIKNFIKTPFKRDGNFVVSNNVRPSVINSVGDFVSALETMPDSGVYWFRGHSNINYRIQPSLFRDSKYYKNEYMMYQELLIRCPESFVSCKTHLDVLVEMQHYGLPTRLLDFTLNPLVALYFACESTNGVGEVITYSLNDKDIVYSKSERVSILSSLPALSYDKQSKLYNALDSSEAPSLRRDAERELKDEIRREIPSFNRNLVFDDVFLPVFVKPPYGNKRIAHQNGVFSLYGLEGSYYKKGTAESRSKKKMEYRYKKDGKIVVFFIPQIKKVSIKASLDRIGINKAYIYPEIDDVADYIKNVFV